MWPMKASIKVTPSPRAPSLKAPRGVAPVGTSKAMGNRPPATGHVVICTGKEMSRNTRPTRAGLKGLVPRPPNVILPTPMATSAPIRIIQMGRLEGRLKPSNRPVRMAEPSQIVSCLRPRIKRVMAHSKHTQAATDVARTMADPSPKK